MVKVDRTSMANSLDKISLPDRTMINDLNHLNYQENLSIIKTRKY